MKGILGIILFLPFWVQSGVISSITIQGNKQTKEHIIHRELTFQKGENLDTSQYSAAIKQSQYNLLNTGLFNFATITFSDSSNQQTHVTIELVERWYIWPEVIIKFQERNFTEWLVERNFSRIDYGLHISHNNMRGRKEKLQIQGRYGFNRKIGLLYNFPYLTKSMKAGLQVAVSYNTQNEVFTGVDSLNKMEYTKNSDRILLETYRITGEYTYRKNFFTTHFLTGEYVYLVGYHELRDAGSDYLSSNNQTQFFSFRYFLKHDRRDARAYPLVGHYGDVEVKQFGFGINKDNLAITRLKTNFRLFYNLYKRWYFSTGFYTEAFSKADIPFYFQDGLGFDRYVRSYEPYVLFGQLSTFAKANLKYQLLKPRSFTLPLIKTPRFSKIHVAAYANYFIDAGYVLNQLESHRRLDNSLLLGTGVGIDFVTFYDLVWRYEYSINKEGEHGFYISFVAPI